MLNLMISLYKYKCTYNILSFPSPEKVSLVICEMLLKFNNLRMKQEYKHYVIKDVHFPVEAPPLEYT